MFNVITPCTRPENLDRMLASLIACTVPAPITWHIIYDTEDILVPNLQLRTPLIKVKEYTHADKRSVVGHAQRNYGMECIDSGFIYFLDDDNIIHPAFFSAVYEEYLKDPYKLVFVVDQIFKNKEIRLIAGPDNTKKFHVDTAQFCIHSRLIHKLGASFDITDYSADGAFIERMFLVYSETFKFINQPLCFYNYLKT